MLREQAEAPRRGPIVYQLESPAFNRKNRGRHSVGLPIDDRLVQWRNGHGPIVYQLESPALNRKNRGRHSVGPPTRCLLSSMAERPDVDRLTRGSIPPAGATISVRPASSGRASDL
jgi:hypothetical protein